jgi:hypothetical protein
MFNVEKFDVIIGNPPYISAVNASKSYNLDYRNSLKKSFTELIGAFNLYVPFLLLGSKLLNKKGIYTWIIPNSFLVSDFSKPTLEKLTNLGLKLILDISDFNVFESASVYPIIILGGNSISKTNKLYCASLDNFVNRIFTLPEEMNSTATTFKSKKITIVSGLTGFSAKSVIDVIKEQDDKAAIPFVVSGNIDPFNVNFNDVRYMGKKYSRAFISKNTSISDQKWKMWLQPKIVIAGMTKKIEAVYIQVPLGIGVGVYAITNFGNYNPKVLTLLLNSKYFSFYLANEFKEKHLQGGYLAINKSTIEALPLVAIDDKINQKLIKYYDNYIDLKEKNHKFTSEIFEQINELIYNIFNISDEDVIKINQWWSK